MTEAMKQVALLRAACCVAGVDGHASEAEQKVLQRLATEAGVGAASLTAMIELAETDKHFYEDQFRVLQADPQEAMQILFRVSLADGSLLKDEALVLKRLSKKLQVPPAQFDAWLQQTLAFLKRKRREK
jgi:tellurite resistance protein